jgi:hypothetical protein
VTDETLKARKRTTRLPFWLERSDTALYETSVYPITSNLWRWEVRCGDVLIRCGTAPTSAAAEVKANEFANI